jgi:hypothetical protein
MAIPTFSPVSTTPTNILPRTGSVASVAATLPYGTYASSAEFLSGAAAAVTYVYYHLGGEGVDIELTEQTVYAAYEDAVNEWSYIANKHQAKNVLIQLLGTPTGSFSFTGQVSGSTINSQISLLYPQFRPSLARRVGEGLAAEGGFGRDAKMYSASVTIEDGKQDYDIQAIISASSAHSASVANKKVIIHRVYYKNLWSTWRFYGYYGGFNVVGNLSTYGQYADDTVFEVVPAWQNKLQAMAFEDSLYTRTSHYSYEIHNNKLRIYPVPATVSPWNLWVQFRIPTDGYDEDANGTSGINGVSSLSNAPFSNIPFETINAIGQHWIRRWTAATCAQILSLVRGKFTTMPIPGGDVVLNWDQLRSMASEEKDKLREELLADLDKLLYEEMQKRQSSLVEEAQKTMEGTPLLIYRI